MKNLKSRLQTALQNYTEQLPPFWQGYFDNISLDFDEIDPDATLSQESGFWPQVQGGPEGAHLFKAFWDLEPEKVRVVIFGNDPYTRLEQATGRSFEQGNLEDWNRDFRRASPSFLSILAAAVGTTEAGVRYRVTDPMMLEDRYNKKGYRDPIWLAHEELHRCISEGAVSLPKPKEIFDHWASQGVLWLNRTLSYTRWDDKHRRSHRELWEPFTNRALEVLVETVKEVRVFVLWGSSAAKLEPELLALAEKKGLCPSAVRIVKTGHPQWPAKYFRSGNPLERINQALAGSTPIRWV